MLSPPGPGKHAAYISVIVHIVTAGHHPLFLAAHILDYESCHSRPLPLLSPSHPFLLVLVFPFSPPSVCLFVPFPPSHPSLNPRAVTNCQLFPLSLPSNTFPHLAPSITLLLPLSRLCNNNLPPAVRTLSAAPHSPQRKKLTLRMKSFSLDESTQQVYGCRQPSSTASAMDQTSQLSSQQQPQQGILQNRSHNFNNLSINTQSMHVYLIHCHPVDALTTFSLTDIHMQTHMAGARETGLFSL